MMPTHTRLNIKRLCRYVCVDVRVKVRTAITILLNLAEIMTNALDLSIYGYVLERTNIRRKVWVNMLNISVIQRVSKAHI